MKIQKSLLVPFKLLLTTCSGVRLSQSHSFMFAPAALQACRVSISSVAAALKGKYHITTGFTQFYRYLIILAHIFHHILHSNSLMLKISSLSGLMMNRKANFFLIKANFICYLKFGKSSNSMLDFDIIRNEEYLLLKNIYFAFSKM